MRKRNSSCRSNNLWLNMDNDHLFVCFSNEALSAPNGTPPFHETIEEFAANLDERSFSEFYEGRFSWHWYPIITSRFTSFPVHGDLQESLSETARLQAIGFAASICGREDGKRFISGLGLLSLLCCAVEEPRSVPSLTINFMRIRESTTRNSIDRNIPHWFNNIALYQLKTGVVPDGYGGTFDTAGLSAPYKGWHGYGMSLEFPLVDDQGWHNCPGGDDAVKKEIDGIKGGDFVLEYQRSALHAGSRFWIWLYRNVSAAPVWNWYVYVVAGPDWKTSVHKHPMHSAVSKSPEELVAEHSFGLKG